MSKPISNACRDDILAIAGSYDRNKKIMLDALHKAGLPSQWLRAWDAKFERIRKELVEQQ